MEKRELRERTNDAGTARAETGIRISIFRNDPAAGAFAAVRFLDGNQDAREGRAGAGDGIGNGSIVKQALGDDEQLREIHGTDGSERLGCGIVRSMQGDRRLQRFADAFLGAGGFQHTVDVATQSDERIPLLHCGIVKRIGGEGLIHRVQNNVARIVGSAVRHGQPDLITSEGEDRSEHFRHAAEDQIQSRLCAAPGKARSVFTVKAILNDIQIETGEIRNAEVIDGVRDHMEFVIVISFRHFFHQSVELCYGPAIQREHFCRRNRIVGIEIGEIAQTVAGCIAEFEILLGELFEDLPAAADIHMVVAGTRPETDEIGTEFLIKLSGVNAVAVFKIKLINSYNKEIRPSQKKIVL